MTKQNIKIELEKKHKSFLEFLDHLPDDLFLQAKSDKWSAAQQLEHIYLSVKLFRQALILPKFMLKIIWGTSNRTGRNYEDLVLKYQKKLSEGGRAPGRFIPANTGLEKRQNFANLLTKEINKINKQIDRLSEHQLDQYILPHPLLGKLTLREMLYFTIYHVQHHQKSIATNPDM